MKFWPNFDQTSMHDPQDQGFQMLKLGNRSHCMRSTQGDKKWGNCARLKQTVSSQSKYSFQNSQYMCCLNWGDSCDRIKAHGLLLIRVSPFPKTKLIIYNRIKTGLHLYLANMCKHIWDFLHNTVYTSLTHVSYIFYIYMWYSHLIIINAKCLKKNMNRNGNK